MNGLNISKNKMFGKPEKSPGHQVIRGFLDFDPV
jgi:hypothetical protein